MIPRHPVVSSPTVADGSWLVNGGAMAEAARPDDGRRAHARFCTGCGERRHVGDRFCHRCGVDLNRPGAPPSVSAAPAAPADRRPPVVAFVVAALVAVGAVVTGMWTANSTEPVHQFDGPSASMPDGVVVPESPGEPQASRRRRPIVRRSCSRCEGPRHGAAWRRSRSSRQTRRRPLIASRAWSSTRGR